MAARGARGSRPRQVDLGPCALPLAAQLAGNERNTVRHGQHPRGDVRRLDLLADDALDRYRELHPSGSDQALDAAATLDDLLDASLRERGLDDIALGRLPRRPVLAVFVCLACGANVIASAEREWAVDRAMRRARLGERDLAAIQVLLVEAFDGAPPSLDEFDAAAIAELASLLGHDTDLGAVRDRVAQLVRQRHRAGDGREAGHHSTGES